MNSQSGDGLGETPKEINTEPSRFVMNPVPDSEINNLNNDQQQPSQVSSDIAALAEALEDKKSKETDPDDSDDDEEIIEESPCGRWLKRREEVKYRDVPGVDIAYLAMDSEEGVEVVWNEANLSNDDNENDKDKLTKVFDALTLIEHPNIVRFHRYWTDSGTEENKVPRLIFITEYMSSGTLKQFLRRTKKNNRKIQLTSWKRWCTQILSALSYLHQTCVPPIVHGNITCDTIFIQHNGLVKIGSIAPDIIDDNNTTVRPNGKNRYYLAPEWEGPNPNPGIASDVYAFGMCALETASLDILTTDYLENNENEKNITSSTINRAIDQLEDELQKDFIRKCLKENPEERPTARELLFHPVLFEVHSLKLLAAHSLANTPGNVNETMTDEAIQSHYGLNTIMATVIKNGIAAEYKLSNVPVAEKLEKFMEDVKFGIYPITAFALSQPPPPKTRAGSPENLQLPEGNTGENPDIEKDDEQEGRRISQMLASIGETSQNGVLNFIVIARLEDCMNRQLTTEITMEDTPDGLADDLIKLNFINELDKDLVVGLFADVFRKYALSTAKKLKDKIEAISEIMPKDIDEISAKSNFSQLKYYFPYEIDPLTKKSVRDPYEALKMRDPTFITQKFPMPEGSFFCPPSHEDGSVPFKTPPSGTNAFDCSHLEAQTSNHQSQLMESFNAASGQNQNDVAFTPSTAKNQNHINDPNTESLAYLQGAQKVLENFSSQQIEEDTDRRRQEDDNN